MEVVSPLASFARVNQGAKRRFGSPIHGGPSSTVDPDFDMDCTGYDFQATKRRKRFSNEGHGNTNNSFSSGQAKENWSFSPFIPSAPRSPQSHAASAGPSAKRQCRTSTAQHDDHASHQKLQELQTTIDQQAGEIQRLKSEKDSAQASAAQLSSQHAKLEQENKILKKAVMVQRERQHQMNAELEGARQFKAGAEERIRRLEQMNLTLQFQHLQANNSSTNDFMGGGFGHGPRPPDVF